MICDAAAAVIQKLYVPNNMITVAAVGCKMHREEHSL